MLCPDLGGGYLGRCEGWAILKGSLGLLRVGHDWATSLSLFTSCIGEGNGNPLQCSCLENPRDGRTWWADVYGVAQSQTRLKRLSSSSGRKFSNCWRQCLNQVRIFVSPQIIKNEKYVSKTYKHKKKKGEKKKKKTLTNILKIPVVIQCGRQGRGRKGLRCHIFGKVKLDPKKKSFI